MNLASRKNNNPTKPKAYSENLTRQFLPNARPPHSLHSLADTTDSIKEKCVHPINKLRLIKKESGLSLSTSQGQSYHLASRSGFNALVDKLDCCNQLQYPVIVEEKSK